MNLSYRRVTPAEVEPLHAIIWECGRDIHARFGMIHWLPPYEIEAMREQAASRNVHAIHADGGIVGTFTTGIHGWNYDENIWADRRHKALYLGKLAIRPGLQGAGIGSWALGQVEQQARDLGCQTVRFDAITAHTRLVNFYTGLGYQPRGPQTVTDPLGRKWEVTALEKVLKPGKQKS